MNTGENIPYTEVTPAPLLQRLGLRDWAWAVLVIAAAVYGYITYQQQMDGYESVILSMAAAGLILLGWHWRAIRWFVICVAILGLSGIFFYQGSMARAEDQVMLKYLLASQSAIMWMSALFILATLAYLGELVMNSAFSGKVGSAMTWSATAMGLTGMLVRWYESYLISPAIGHIPVSNLYEVFILFCLITALIYLYYEQRFATRAMGGFVLLIISAAVGFLLWYTFDRGAHEIQPLVPALQSYWMKIHVPANFIGYGCFSLAAMLGSAYLVRTWCERRFPGAGFVQRLPAAELLDDVMYKSIALGFAFFTIATILGALWAAEAWGGYWSWDPKETWALIVWLNYAAWLHMRMTKGWRGAHMAWWAVAGLLVTLFAFLGVNMFLSGLHSYGEL